MKKAGYASNFNIRKDFDVEDAKKKRDKATYRYFTAVDVDNIDKAANDELDPIYQAALDTLRTNQTFNLSSATFLAN